MAKTKKDLTYLQFIDAGAQVLALWFVSSVINNTRDLIEQGIKNAPATYFAILAIILTAYSWYSRKKLNTWNIVTLTILATSTTIWLFGLSTRAGF